MKSAFEPLSIYIGVTGHRDIAPEHISSLIAEVERLLLSLRSCYRHCSITVLSSLADGADRLCARAALNTGCRLIVPLPMAVDEYINDFDEASKHEFEELCGKAGRVVTVPGDEPKPEDTPRGYFYRQAGRYVAEHSHILIALWDGRETVYHEGGGTFETIGFARERKREVLVVQIPKPGEAFTGGSAVPDSQALSTLNEFSGDIAAGGEGLLQSAWDKSHDLIDAQSAQTLSNGATRVLSACLLSDALSVKYSSLRLTALRLLSLFGLLLVLSFLLYDEMESDLMLFVYAALILAAFVVHRIASKSRLHGKYTAYRVIAEALRVQFYWGLCGISDRASNSYAFTQKAALGFVDDVLLSLWEDRENFGPAIPQIAKEFWIRRQLDYHAASDRQKTARESFHRGAEKVMLILSILLFVLVAGMELLWKEALEAYFPLDAARGFLLIHDGPVVWRGVLKILLGTVSAGTAFLSNYYGSLALPQQIFDNRRMKGLFESAISADPAAEEAFINAMRTVGRESMIECGGWYVGQRENAPGLFIG